MQAAFMEDALEVVVATSAFGMGIDKANVRFVFHLDVPGSLDAYYQEIGRAGRGGALAEAVLFYHPEDLKLQRFFAGGTTVDPEELERVATFVAAAQFPVEQEQLREATGVSEAKLLAALHRLEEVGALTINPEGWVVPDQNAVPDAVEAAEQAQANFKMFEASRLEMMRGYAEAKGCRREYLLGYFGEPSEGPCGNCDRCRAGASETPVETPFPIGSRVEHGSFGEGQVVRYEAAKVVILFDTISYQALALNLVLGNGLLELVQQA